MINIYKIIIYYNYFSNSLIFLAGLAQESWRDLATVNRQQG